VPTWPISDSAISSLLTRSFDCGFMNVRFKCMSKRRGNLQGLRDIELLVDAGDIAAGMGAAVHVFLDPIVLSCVNMGSGRGAA
jgi:hypothetical protein